jgi:phage-related minor tail protein
VAAAQDFTVNGRAQLVRETAEKAEVAYDKLMEDMQGRLTNSMQVGLPPGGAGLGCTTTTRCSAG